MISIERIKDTKILSLLNYMKTHNKDNPTFFHLKELSAHLGLDEDETLKILKEAKKLGYIKSSGGLISDEVVNSFQYSISEIGIEEVKNNLKNKFSAFVEHPIFKLIGVIIGFYTIYEVIIK
ncbi:hypothetical protein [Aliarcobacter butzleri]|uniref:hypothetical protein n=1 Tax=Aliarcobacter butzleri TaxID=28197 RepID=UPI001260AA00|nr:hypothetical protein [Aliarcobacter butzleri]